MIPIKSQSANLERVSKWWIYPPYTTAKVCGHGLTSIKATSLLWLLLEIFLWEFPSLLQWSWTRSAKICGLHCQMNRDCRVQTDSASPQAPSPRHGSKQWWHSCLQGCSATNKLSSSCQQDRKKKITFLRAAWINKVPSTRWKALYLIKPSWCSREERCYKAIPRGTPTLEQQKTGAAGWAWIVGSSLGTGECHTGLQVVSRTWLFADHSTLSH